MQVKSNFQATKASCSELRNENASSLKPKSCCSYSTVTELYSPLTTRIFDPVSMLCSYNHTVSGLEMAHVQATRSENQPVCSNRSNKQANQISTLN